MSEAPVSRPERPGVVRVVIMALLVSMFAVKAVRWWLAVSAGTTTVEAMTTSGWVRVGFYHLAVVAGVAGIAGMLRTRARTGGAEPLYGLDLSIAAPRTGTDSNSDPSQQRSD